MKPVHDLSLHHARGSDLDHAARRHVVVRCLEIECDVALEDGFEVFGVQELQGLEESESEASFAPVCCLHNLPNLLNLLNPPRSGGGRHVPHTRRDEHAPHRNLQPPLRLDHDVLLRRDRRVEPRGECHGFGDVGRVGELVVPLLERVAIRSYALRQDLIDQRRQGAVRPGQGAEVLHLIDEAPQFFRVGVVRRPAPGESANGRQEIACVPPLRVSGEGDRG